MSSQTQQTTLAQQTVVIVCTYNEIENLPMLIEQVREQLPGVHVLIVDDNSPDGTGQWCLDQKANITGLDVIIREGKLGLGSATIAGFRRAIEQGYDLIVTMDADFSHHPSHLPALVGAMQDASVDISIGSRYVAGGKIEGWPFHRRFISRWLNRSARLALGISVRDCSGAFRCYRSSVLRKLDFDQLKSTGYSYLEEILWWLKTTGAKMVEVPITFRDRELGVTKINHKEAVGAVLMIGRMGLRNWFGRKPIVSKEG